jgi:protein-disulfide isomerase
VPGKVNLVEIMDFQCPHCQQLHPMIKRILREEGASVHLIRIVCPMMGLSHPHSRGAAAAYLCAQAQGKGEAMADALFEAEDLTPASCERLAVELGLSKTEYQTCVVSADIEKIIDATKDWVKTACPRGVPCVWVQDRRLRGMPTLSTLQKAVEDAKQRLQISAP